MMDFDKIKDAVNSIEMSKSMETRIKKKFKLPGKKQSGKQVFKRWIPAASAFGILLTIMIVIPFFNKNGSFSTTSFTITAYAESYDGKQLHTQKLSSDKATFELSTEQRMGVINSVSGDGSNLLFTDVKLKLSGENIDSITYTINEGKFIEDVTLTADEIENKAWLLEEKIYIIYGEPDSETYKGIKEIGETYRVKYDEQDKYNFSLAVPHFDNAIQDDIIINAIVKFTDGSTEHQDIAVTQESNSISLVLQ